MSKKVMVLWFYVIFGLVLTICLIGVKEKDFKYDDLKDKLVTATKKYISDKQYNVGVSDSVLVYVSELIDEKYITEEELKDYCFDNVVYYNGKKTWISEKNYEKLSKNPCVSISTWYDHSICCIMWWYKNSRNLLQF